MHVFCITIGFLRGRSFAVTRDGGALSVTDGLLSIREIGALVSAVGAGGLAFVGARNRQRRPWTWGIAAFLFVVPALLIPQLAPPSEPSREANRWWVRIVAAVALIAASVLIDTTPIASPSIAALEARAAASWFADRVILAEGAVLHAPSAQLELSGNPTRPIVLGLVGAALGLLVLRHTLASVLGLAFIGALLGAAAWFVSLISAMGEWLDNPLETPDFPTGSGGAAFLSLLWIAIGLSWLAPWRGRAAQGVREREEIRAGSRGRR